jgi:integral membrane protein
MKLNYNLKTPEGRFFAVAFLEGISYLILLFIAMPLKYFAGQPEMVKRVGMAHGLLFVLFVLTLIHVATENEWKWKKALVGFGYSLLPFGTFWFEAKHRKQA